MRPRIALLSRNAALYSTQRLIEAARQRGCTVRVLDPLRCALKVAPGAFELRYRGKPLPKIDAVIPRIGHSVTFHGTAVLRQMELMGVATPSTAEAILSARDKLRCHQILAAEGIDLPVTAFGDSPDDTPVLIDLVGPAPHVVKLNEGTQGSGVVLARDAAASRSVIEAFRGLYASFLVQEFIGEAKGTDLRCFVVGNEVVAAMQRRSAPGDFRANLHRGGKAALVSLDAAEKAVAVRAAQRLGLGVAGVDLLRSNRGPLLLEVNSSPGLEGIEAASGIDIAGRILDHVLGLVVKVRRRTGRGKTVMPDTLLD